jgi:hypothetical protein
MIARVFPGRTNATPDDEYAFTGEPHLFIPDDIDEVHVSVTFTWDMAEAERLARAWNRVAPVKIGGPATGMRGGEFVPNRYVRNGYVITSRGCNSSCWFCSVPKREGPVRELPIREGWNILDDNLLACSENHIREVFQMLEGQKRHRRRTFFTGGLDAALIREWHVGLLMRLRPKKIFFGCDTEEKYHHLSVAMKLFREAGYASHNTLGAYVLVGYPGDSLGEAERRLQRVWDLGVTPMAMLYRDSSGAAVKGPDENWRRFQRLWARPALIHMAKKCGHTQARALQYNLPASS